MVQKKKKNPNNQEDRAKKQDMWLFGNGGGEKTTAKNSRFGFSSRRERRLTSFSVPAQEARPPRSSIGMTGGNAIGKERETKWIKTSLSGVG